MRTHCGHNPCVDIALATAFTGRDLLHKGRGEQAGWKSEKGDAHYLDYAADEFSNQG